VVATTKEGYLIPTYGPTGISPSAGAEAGMAAGRAVQTQREQTLNSRQARNSVDQQMKIRTEEQRRIEENRVIAAAERARLEAAQKKYAAGLSLPGMEAAAVPTDSGVVAAPGAQRAGLSFGPNTPAMEPVTMGVQPISFGPSTPAPTYVPPAGARATVAARQQDTPLTTRLAPVWAQLEQQGGLPQGYFRRLAEVESSLNPEARNPKSTASGCFSFAVALHRSTTYRTQTTRWTLRKGLRGTPPTLCVRYSKHWGGSPRPASCIWPTSRGLQAQ